MVSLLGPFACQGGLQEIEKEEAQVGHHGSSPLHFAAEHDAAGVLRALLAAAADLGLGDDQGDTALHCAMLYGSPRAMEALLEHPGAVEKENHSGELALHLMAEFGPGDESLPEQLERRHFARLLKCQELLMKAGEVSEGYG